MLGYIEHVRQWSAARHAAAAAERAHNARPLEIKIQDHFAAIPPQDRRAYYTMSEMVLLFNAASGRIGTALHRLGWERRRRWSEGGIYGRYWVPAQIN